MHHPVLLVIALVAIAALFMLGGCANKYQPEPVVAANAPVHQLNPTKWVALPADLLAQ